MIFTFLREKWYLNIVFSLWMSVKQLAKQGHYNQLQVPEGNFGSKLTHLCGFWFDVSIFLTREQLLFFAILFGHIDFFTREKHRSLFWFARSDLCMEININENLAFQWVSQYVYE